MTHALPPLTKETVEAFVASAVALAWRLVLVLIRPRAQQRARILDSFVARLERRAECILFLKACLALGPGRRRRRLPSALAPGFRRGRGRLRHFLKSCRVRARNATPIARLARLLSALAHSDAYVAHFMRRMLRGLSLGGIVACAPPAVALCADALCVCAFSDSS